MAWGLKVVEDFKEPWANKFPDAHASSAHVDVFYNNALVYRDIYVLGDGARCYLPLPKTRETPGAVPEGYARFVRLLDLLEGHSESSGTTRWRVSRGCRNRHGRRLGDDDHSFARISPEPWKALTGGGRRAGDGETAGLSRAGATTESLAG